MIDWKREIDIACLVKQRVAEVDSKHLWEFHPPEVAATEEAIVAVEQNLGFNLDAEYRAFLRQADGWNGFMQNNDVLRVAELVAGPRHQKAIELLQSLEDLKPICGFEQNELLPFALSSTSIDLFVIAKPNSQSAGVVLWFAGQVIDRFPSFSEWFLAMVDYNRREFQRFTGQLGN